MRSIILVAMLAAGPLLAADLNGDWIIEGRLGEAPIVVNCTLIHSGDQLTGTCTPVMENPESSELTGRADESTASWEYDVVFNGNPGHVAFDAEIESDSRMKGTLDLSGMPVEFTAMKRAASSTDLVDE